MEVQARQPTQSPPVPSGTARANPFVGPRPLLEGEPLYGRDLELYQFVNLLIAERIVALYSPSGAGKTSLLQAGLIPRLKAEAFTVLPVLRVNPQLSSLHFPSTAAGAVTGGHGVNPYVLSALLSLEEPLAPAQRLPPDRLLRLDLASYLERRPVAPDAPPEQVLLFDQFEEILAVDPTDHDVKEDFFTQLGEALLDRRRWAVFALREDYLPGLEPYVRILPTRLRTTFRLDLLEVEAAAEAIRRPSQQVGIDFTEGAVQKLLDDLRRVRVQRPDGTTYEQLVGHAAIS